jgi:hypothetical protein
MTQQDVRDLYYLFLKYGHEYQVENGVLMYISSPEVSYPSMYNDLLKDYLL